MSYPQLLVYVKLSYRIASHRTVFVAYGQPAGYGGRIVANLSTQIWWLQRTGQITAVDG